MTQLLLFIVNRLNQKLNFFSHDIHHLRDLRDIDRNTFLEILRYIMVGLTNTLIYGVTGIILHRIFDFTALYANLLALSVSFIIGFIGHNFVTYRQEKMHLTSFFRFIFLQLLALSISQSIVYIVVNLLGWVYEIALIISIAVLPPLCWSLGHTWIFKGKQRAKKNTRPTLP